MSILSLVSTIPSIIAVELRNEDVVAGVRAIVSSPLVGALEAAAEKTVPKLCSPHPPLEGVLVLVAGASAAVYSVRGSAPQAPCVSSA